MNMQYLYGEKRKIGLYVSGNYILGILQTSGLEKKNLL